MLSLDFFTCGPFETNAYLLGCTDKERAMIIDPAQGSYPLLMRAAQEKKLKIEGVLLTHSHWDHIIDLAKIVEDLSIPVYVHREDRDNVQSPGVDGLPLLFPCRGVEEVSCIEDGQKIKIGSLIIDVLHTPGHSPGSVCFYAPEYSTLISGDTLFKGSMGNISFPGSDPKSMWQSLKRLSELPPGVATYPGHGDTTTIGEEGWMSRAQEIFGVGLR